MSTLNGQLERLAFLNDHDLERELISNGEIASFRKGDIIVREGQYVKFLPIVLQGAIRVFQQKEDREITLYHVRADETCTMSLAAAYFENKSTSHGVAVENTEVLVFPATLLTEWQLKFPSWNKYVMKMFRKRYDELIGEFEKVVFDPVNVRVLEYLHKMSKLEGGKKINISHQTLAREIGTTRVVVSRILKQFEKNKKVKLYRGAIELCS